MHRFVILIIVLGIGTAQSNASHHNCDCPSTCPEVTCQYEELRVRDECNCCDTCLGLEGAKCGRGLDGKCALPHDKHGFSCVVDPESEDHSGRCHCKHSKKGPFCGQDGTTYKSKCDLQVASWVRSQRNSSHIGVAYNGECQELPVLTRAPVDVRNRSGEKAYLSCEAYGIPTPRISFRKITLQEDSEDLYEEMPSDRLNMAVQIRGGPDKHKISAWVLVDPLTADDDAYYECLASNTQGSVSGRSRLTVH